MGEDCFERRCANCGGGAFRGEGRIAGGGVVGGGGVVLLGECRVPYRGDPGAGDCDDCGDRGELDDLLRATCGEVGWASPPGEIS